MSNLGEGMVDGAEVSFPWRALVVGELGCSTVGVGKTPRWFDPGVGKAALVLLILKFQVTICWITGHEGIAANERVNKTARTFAR